MDWQLKTFFSILVSICLKIKFKIFLKIEKQSFGPVKYLFLTFTINTRYAAKRK